MVDWLLRHRLVKKTIDTDAAILSELFSASAHKFACPQCGGVALVARRSEPLDEEGWGAARKCEWCGAAIPAARLEVYPDARLCVACQGRDERGELMGPAEYCPRCGSVMSLERSRGAGITRYVMTCRSCGHKP